MLASLVLMACLAAETPSVPDPYGLGERLALIDHLQSEYGLALEPGLSLEALRQRHHDHWQQRRQAEEDPLVRDERGRLRERLQREFGIVTRADEDLAALRARLAAQRQPETTYSASLVIGLGERQRPERPATDAADDPPAAPRWMSRDLPRFAGGVRRVLLWNDGETAVLCVQIGDPGAVDFDGGCAYFAQQVRQAPTRIRRAVYLIGHGGGQTVGGLELEDLLRTHQIYLETLGGTAERAPIDCLVLASCSRGGASQMGDLADGLGYLPYRRVATAHRTYATLHTVIAATAAVLAHTGTEPLRASFRLREGDLEAASTGEVGTKAKTGELTVFRIRLEGQSLVVEPQR